MTRSVAMRSVLESTSPAAIVEFSDGGYHWTIGSNHASALRSGSLDWFNLHDDDRARLVKRNSHRDVWEVTYAGQNYFAKLYHPSDVAAKAKLLVRGPIALREWEVGRYAAAHAIATVVPVATALKGYRGLGGPSLLITEAVPDAEPLNAHWLRIRDDRHRANLLIEALARLIARAHQCGFRHGDMHPGNLLVRPIGHRAEVLFVDLHNVRIAGPVSRKEVVANLAELNQWFRRHSTRSQRRRFLDGYLSDRDQFAQAGPFARNLSFEPKSLVADLALRADKHANRLWAKRDRRTRRTGRYFAKIRPAPGWRGHVLLHSKHPSPSAVAARLSYRRDQWQDWLRDPLSWVDPARRQLLKDSHSAMICRAELPVGPESASVIVKRPLARNFWRQLRHVLGPSRTMRAWKTANALLNRDLPVAQPLAVVERFVLGVIRVDSLGFIDFIPDSVDLETFLTRDVAALGPARQYRIKQILLDELVRLVRAFHDRGFAHRDFKAPNLLVSWLPPYASRPKLTFIDMDGIRHVGRPSERDCAAAVLRLGLSLFESPACTRTDRLRFLLRYPPTAGDWKRRWREMDRQAGRKQHHKNLRREWKMTHYGRE